MHKNFDNTSRDGWETNSSSSHSLVLDPSAPSILREASEFGGVRDGVLTIYGKQEFGWEWEIWDSPEEKINYLLIDGFDEGRMKKILKERLGVRDVVIGKSEYRYIDHQSMGTSSDVRALDDDGVWAFITNPANMVRGGNDNSEGPW